MFNYYNIISKGGGGYIFSLFNAWFEKKINYNNKCIYLKDLEIV